MYKTGHSLIKAKMKEEHAELAGEMSGHMFFADRYFGYDDALYAACRLIEIVADSGKPLSAQLAGFPKAGFHSRNPRRLSRRNQIRSGRARRRTVQEKRIRPSISMACASFSRRLGTVCAPRTRSPCW